MFGSASAHPGRTDANGGHYDSSTGEYHYHHGYPAHQHTNGICPYDFDDQTEHRSESSESYRRQTIAASEQDETRWYTVILDFSNYFWFIIQSIVVLAAIYWFFYFITYIPRIIQKHKERKKYKFLYSGSIETLCSIPSDTEIGSDGLPKEKGADGWGKKYTVYRSRTGKVFHRAGCNPAANIPVHVFTASSLKPCKKCNPELPDKQWFIEYSRIKQIKNKYKIP